MAYSASRVLKCVCGSFVPQSRAFSLSNRSMADINNLTIIGAGQMGAGIAQVSAQHHINVILVDMDEGILKKASAGIDKSLQRVARKNFPDDSKAVDQFIADNRSRLSTSTDSLKSVADADLVIEAVVENLPLKQNMFKEFEKAAKKTCIFTTNTSSLALEDISKFVEDKSRFGGLHFFNPVSVMKLLEVVSTQDTSADTHKTLMEYGKKIGKTTVECKDTPGFIVNRLLVPYMMEALRMAERGDATFKDIDIAMKLGAGYPMGPFELADYVGLDTTKFIIDGWAKTYPGNPLFQPSPTLNKMVEEKKYGRKSGEGFYKY